MVFEHERDDPDYVIYQRSDRRRLDRCHVCGRAANQDSCRGSRLDFTGAGRRSRSLPPLRVGDPRFAITVVRVTVPRLVSGAGALGFTRLVVVLFAETDSISRQWSPNSPAACPPCGRYQTAGSVPTRSIGSRSGRPVDPPDNRPPAALRSTTRRRLSTPRAPPDDSRLPADPIQPGSRD